MKQEERNETETSQNTGYTEQAHMMQASDEIADTRQANRQGHRQREARQAIRQECAAKRRMQSYVICAGSIHEVRKMGTPYACDR